MRDTGFKLLWDKNIRLHFMSDSEGLKSIGIDKATLAQKLVHVMAQILGVDPTLLKKDTELKMFGLESVTLTEFCEQVSVATNIKLNPTILYQYTSIESISNYLADNHKKELITLYPLEITTRDKAQGKQEAAESPLQQASENKEEAIAIVGISCRFPGAGNKEEFWQNLIAGKNAISEIPADRFNPPNQFNKGGFLNDIKGFDADFFRISRKEAELMDPQQRILLEEVWKVFEDAGENVKQYDGKEVGVFVGVCHSDYKDLLLQQGIEDAHAGLGSSFSIIPNRISYFLNLKGPSLAIDTACSSSLVAVHQAIQSIENGECDTAIAAGVNIICAPGQYITYGKAGMLAPDGQCKTFDKNANGYVRGEGLGVILLKPLSKALKENNRIYGLIQGSAVNHGGLANSLTAPNPAAQADLIQKALKKANFEKGTITYVEAHGTGTRLGDPIELNGIKKGLENHFSETGQEKICGIGSLKTNIGHLESAAGIAGLIKIMLSMQHQKLPATINLAELNPLIELDETSFYILQKAKEWIRIQDKNGNNIPYRAGLSSFGSGGTNAHVLVEEYFQQTRPTSPSQEVIIVLSAKSAERVQAYAKELVNYLEREKPLLTDFAYTLQAGRNAMDYRIAFVAGSMKEVRENLINVSEGKPGLVIAESKMNSSLELILSGKAGEAFVKVILEEGDLSKITQLWMQGVEVDWSLLYSQLPQRIALPTYPFESKAYWLDIRNNSHNKGITSQLHPLLSENTSTLFEQKFKIVLDADRYYLRDHVIGNKKVLVGVAGLEMALQAGQIAGNQQVQAIENINWLLPVFLQTGSQELELRLKPVQGCVEAVLADGAGNIYSQYRILFSFKRNPQNNVNIQQIISNAVHYQTGTVCYEAFAQKTFAYGNAFQVIQDIWSTEKEALSLLKIPASKEAGFDQYVLHPSLLDGALQTALSLTLSSSELMLPFGMDRLEVIHPLTKECYAYVRKREFQEAKQQVFDIQLLDPKGTVLVNMTGFSLRALHVEKAEKVLTYSHEWNPQPVTAENNSKYNLLMIGADGLLAEALLQNGHHLLQNSIGSDYQELLLDLKEANQYPDVIVYQSDEEEHLFPDLLSLSKAVIEQTKESVVQLLFLSNGSLFHAAASGLLKSLNQESTKVNARAIERGPHPENWINEEIKAHFSGDVRYINGAREIKTYQPVRLSALPPHTAFRQGGVYLITGGIGGLGLLFANYLSEKYDAKLVLAGRSALDEKGVEVLRKLGSKVIYIQADITKEKEVVELIAAIETKFGQLHGILHAAGVIRDSIITKKKFAEAELVLAPKIQGTLLLDKATAHLNLDFFTLCSSITAISGNAGQADYAYANAFMDAFASQRNGRTVSINWPLWAEGGMQVEASVQEWMKKHWGMSLLSTPNGLNALEHCLMLNLPNIGVAEGEISRMKSYLKSLSHAEITKTKTPGTGDKSLKERISTYLKEIFAVEVKLNKDEMEEDKPFEKYGIDSLLINNINAVLERKFGELPRTLLFEYTNLSELTDYFVSEHAFAFPDKEGVNSIPEVTGKGAQSPKAFRFSPDSFKTIVPERREDEDIAIIGLSGRYPQSKNVEEYWKNLSQGLDCITEIPEERWNWRAFAKAFKEQGSSEAKWGGFMEDVDKFDPLFFGVSPREAELMDPQERLFMQTVYHTLEDAGYSASSLDRQTGVFVGVMWNEYQLIGEAQKSNYALPMSNHWSIANRISFFFNFRGPSMAIDTACSSSLTAIHQACESIKRGESKLAIAGGINLSIHPNKFQVLSQNHFASSDGRCRSFGKDGDGYVPGEGVGAVLLKPLQQAIADGDQIYAVIKGSSVNHGGATNGFTVPNPNAQAELVKMALDNARIDPRTISYIEAHGTGTALGDPIEIAGLTKAFAHFTSDRQFCAIGSSKSNIGHLEASAGIAGITKLLLQLKHKMLVPSLHSEVLNENIRFEKTPFYVQKTLGAWTSNNQLRRAAISSFGAGGSNAHVIIEEFVPSSPVEEKEKTVMIVLSARTEERLRVYAAAVSDYALKSKDSITDLAYTLQVGREAMDWRLSFVASSMEETGVKLKAFSEGKLELNFANIKKIKKTNPLSGSGQEAGYFNNVSAKQNSQTLGEQWMQGAKVNWITLYDHRPRRISLPTYPFESKRYWLDGPVITQHSISAEALHPLLTENISTLHQQRFRTVLNAEKYYFTDHVINNRKMLAGVASLEMALQASQKAGNQEIRLLENISWLRPVVLEEGELELQVSLTPTPKGVAFKLVDEAANEYSGCNVSFELLSSLFEKAEIEEIKLRSNNNYSGSYCYEAFAKRGFTYGDAFQVIQQIWSSGEEAISLLKLPDTQEFDFGHYVLHPSLMDGALQTVLGLHIDSPELLVPFGMERLELLSPLTKECFVHVKARGNSDMNQRVFDLQILDLRGKVLINIAGFSVRIMQAEKADEVMVFFPEWIQRPLEIEIRDKQNILFIGANSLLEEALLIQGHQLTVKPKSISYHEQLLELKTANQSPHVVIYQITEAGRLFEDLLSLSKALIEQITGSNTQLILLSPGGLHESAAAGLLKTLGQEFSKISARVIYTDAFPEKWIGDEISELFTGEVRYIRNQREVKINYLQLLPSMEKTESAFRNGGTYLITGGAGGLGLIFARYLREQYDANLVLVGRSSLNDKLKNQLDALGSKVIYVQSDITNAVQVNELITEAIQKFGHLHGILHAAGITRDATIVKKDIREAEQVLAPKIQGTILLEKATRDLNLDFLMLCSSIAATTGNTGQSDYAYANSFLDAFAREGKGNIVSINWPLWADGGMHVDEQTLEWMKKRWGMGALSTKNGLQALEFSLAHAASNIGVVEGNADRLTHYFNQLSLPRKTRSSAQPEALDVQVYQQLEKELVGIVSEILKLDIQDIDTAEDMSGFGFDSITLTKFTNELNKKYELLLSPAILFEYRSLASFTEYLVNNHPDEVNKLGTNSRTQTKNRTEQETRPTNHTPEYRSKPQTETMTSNPTFVHEPIAIIGMHGRMPNSNDLNAFWGNLLDNKNLISRIPPERWASNTGPQWGGLIQDMDKFDAAFFNISPREAELMDPQQRIFIESVWKCIEDSGYSPKALSGSNTGVFVGIATNDYFRLMDKNTIGKPHSSTGTAHSITPNRISYLLNLHGPSEPIDTACSSALVAIHKGVRAIQSGDCDMAIAGGVNALLSPDLFSTFGNAGMLSADGSCKTFDGRANGYVRSEGVGCILLKALSKAEADGDHIYGVIRGSSENHGGHVNSITVPNPNAQAALLVNAYNKAGVSAESVGYIEAHGTGTPLGDPIEINALKKAFGELYERNGHEIQPDSIGIGAVKSNVGHLEAAAGMAGMFKVLLALKHKMLPGNIHFDKQNQYIDLAGSPFYIVAKNREWKAKTDQHGTSLPRIAGVSSFGFGGVNAHVIVEEYTDARQSKQQDSRQVIVLSAKSAERLRVYAKELADYLEINKSPLADIAFTLQTGRVAMNYRLAFVASTVDEVCRKLKDFTYDIPDNRLFLSPTVTSSDPDVQPEAEAIDLDAAIRNKDLIKLAQCWASGRMVEWKSIYTSLPNRTPLPTYPFERKSYWMDQKKEVAIVGSSSPNSTVFLEQVWKKLPVSSTGSGSDVESIVWLVNEASIQDAQRLKAHYPSYIHRILSIRELTQARETFSGNIALIDLSEISVSESATVVNWEKIGFYQQIIQQAKSLNVFYFTKCAQAFRNEQLTLNGSFISGLLPAVDAEYGKIRIKTIDFDNNTSLASILDKEWKDTTSGSLCYRNGERFELGYQQLEGLPETRENKWGEIGNKTVVITGGTGGIGLNLTQSLAQKGVKKIVLLGRRPLSDDTQEVIRKLREKGTEVNYLACALTDSVKLKSFFKERSKMGEAIAGVIHCAGTINTDEPAFVHKTQSQMQSVFEPKTEGLKVLDEVLNPYNPDFFVLFSSISTLPKLGTGASDYSAANSWMNFYANYQKALGKKYFKSIIWPLWDNTGMGKGESGASLKMGFIPLKGEQGLELLERIVFNDCPNVIMPCIVDHAVFDADKLLKVENTRIPQAPKAAGKAINAPTGALNKRLLRLFSEVLKLDESEIEMNANFAELGVDSILIASLVKRLESEFGISIEPSAFIEQSCINDFANYLRKNHPALSEDTAVQPTVMPVESELKKRLLLLLSEVLNLKKEEINSDISFSELGIDPVITAQIVKRLKQVFDIQMEPRALMEHATIDDLLTSIQNHSYNTIKFPTENVASTRATQNKGFASYYEPIAVIGIACQFPESPDKETFWKNLVKGKDCVTTVPDSRWKSNELYSSEITEGKSISKWGGFIKDIELFDPLYFGITEANAIDVDPLQRKFLETCIQAVHDAGYDKKSLWDKKVGVFVGSRIGNYSQKLKKLQKSTILGVGQNYIAALASQVFNWRGPNLVIDSACSSSLVSIHLACQSLRTGESTVAVAGGVDILLDEKGYLALSKSGALSPDGKCFTFDEKANGFVPGEGCGIVLLKRMSDALTDGDKIYAVIDGSAVNNDGNTMGATTPNPKAQKEVIQEALQKANINPETIGLMEAHGTGTLIGDPIELKALTETYREYTSATGYCAVGSVKTNIGHLLSAAGVAGFIKSVLSVYHKQLPPTLHCSVPNPRFNFKNSPFFPNTQCLDWQKETHRAAMSSFGFGGTNAHVIVSDAHLKEGYHPEKTALAPVLFNKKRFWYTEEKVVEKAVEKKIAKNGMDAFFAFEKQTLEKSKI